MGERSQDILARRSEGGGIMKIPISKLLNNTGQIEGVPTNPRTIDKADYQKLLKSIQEDPEYLDHEKPHVIAHGDKYVVLNGNQRLRALKELGYKETECEVYKPDTPAKVLRARIIKSNHGYGKDDIDLLANEWYEDPLDDWGFERPDDWKDEEEIVEDVAPEVDETEPPKSKRGEVYQLGRHFVMCGDATSEDDVAKLMNGKKAQAVYTDPPYGVKYVSKKLGGIKNDDIKDESMYDFVFDSFNNIIKYIDKSAGVYCWYEDKYRHEFQRSIEDAGFEFKQNLIWNKGMNLSGADYQKAHENCMYFQVKGSKAWFVDARDNKTILGMRRIDIVKLPKNELVNMIMNIKKETTVWDYDRDNVTTYVHPTQEPVVMSANTIKNSTQVGQAVIDVFLGSGATLIACEQAQRDCYGMELDEKYVDVIRKRYWKFINDGDEEGWENGTKAIN